MVFSKDSKNSTHVAINAHLLSGETGYRRAGIHQYIYQVLRHLSVINGVQYSVFTRHPSPPLAPISRHITTKWATERPLVRILWEQLVWPLWLARHHPTLLHSMAFVTPIIKICPAVVTVYDLSFIHYPDRFPRLKRLYLTTQTRRSCQEAARIITISESSRQDVHTLFGIPLSHIEVVYPGVDSIYQRLPTEAVERFRQEQQLPPQFILHVGTLQPRKNIPILLDAFARLPFPDLHLVLVGGKGWFFDEIFARVEALGLGKRVIFSGYVPDEALPFWYNAATLFVLPSLYEGFGLPVTEAMACGTPVIAANVSSLPEAVGKAGLLFAPKAVDELVEKIMAVLQNRDLALDMSQRGVQQATTFSWQEAGRKTSEIYQLALNQA